MGSSEELRPERQHELHVVGKVQPVVTPQSAGKEVVARAPTGTSSVARDIERTGDARAQTQQESAHSSASDSKCPQQKPIHCLLTSQATVYQQWQARIMYFHWVKQAKLDGECTDMTGFTRLVASEDGKPDGLEVEMPSVFVKQLTAAELATLGHFGVMNRPYSVVQYIAQGHLDRLKEDYVYIAETDHVFMKPLKNLATPETPVAFGFGYMHCGPSHQGVISKHSPGTSWQDVQNVGPSPVLISKAQLIAVTPPWYNISVTLKRDPQADHRFGWVLEMWGYSIAAASLKIKHRVLSSFQIEGGAGIGVPSDRYIFHYTYGLEYALNGRPQTGQIGEWSLDKRHYGTSYPPRNLQPPPEAASEGTKWLLQAFNEASAGIPSWPETKALGTLGWRRVAGTGIRGSDLARRLMGTSWTWSGIKGLQFMEQGQMKTPWGTGVWGILPTNIDYRDAGFCAPGCAFVDFSGALHNLRFDWNTNPPSFKTYRVGDGESISGTQVF